MNKTFSKVIKLLVIAVVVLVSANVAEARLLSVGSTGSDVATLQTWLIDHGYPIPWIENGVASKGYFGQQTKTAVQIYQEDKGLPLTGTVDSDSYNTAVSAPLILGGAGPDISGPYRSVGGVREWAYRMPMVAATTTPCAFPFPEASSTLAFFSVSIDTATSTAGSLTIGTSTTAFATTTVLNNFAVAAGTAWHSTYIATSSPNGMLQAGKRGHYVVLSAAGAPGDSQTNNGFTYGGHCSVQFRQVQY